MTLVFVGGVLMGLVLGSADHSAELIRFRSRMLRRIRVARRQRDEWRERHAAVWRAGAESLARCRRPERDWRDTVDTDAQEGD